MHRLVATLITLFGLSASLFAGNAQKPATSKYFHSMGGGFGSDGQKHELWYGVTLAVRTPIPDGAVADFLFENPVNAKEPLLTSVVIKGNPKTVEAKSPPLPGIENNRVYTYRVILYRDETRKEKLGEHVQGLGFSVPKDLFEKVFKPWFPRQP